MQRSTMRSIPWAAGLLAVACSSLDAGREEEDPGPPVLLKITVQSNLRYLLTDLLDVGPERACSDTDPCPTEAPGSPICRIAEGETMGTCPRVFSPSGTPPAVDPFSNELRFVFNKALDPAIGPEIESGAPIITLQQVMSSSVPVTAYYAPSGAG